MTLRVAGAARATTGQRANQEDAFAIWPPGAQTVTEDGKGLLAVVADGMGGHAGGEVAGQLASETFLSAFSCSDASLGGRLRDALDAANSAIAARAAADEDLHGMGCTLIGAWIDGDGLHWVSVGDSLLLLFRAPDVLRLNADHSLGAFLDDQVRRKLMAAEEAENNPYRNALRSAVTGKNLDIVDLHAESYPLAPGDWVILASDGIATLSGDEISDIVYAGRDATPDEMAESLIAAVLAKNEPEQDNTTIIAVKIGEGTPRHAANDAAPTRILRADTDPVTTLVDHPDAGVETTQRIVEPSGFRDFLSRYRNAILGIGMGIMFLVGWMVRALSE